MLYKTQIIVVSFIGIILLTNSHCENVTLSKYPDPPAEADQQKVSGSFANAVNTLTSPFGKHSGSLTKAVPTAMPVSWDWRCNPIPVVQLKAIIDDSDVKISVSWPSSTIYTPKWINRTSHCFSATNEWNAFYNRVKTHELGHHATTANYCVESIIIPGYFTGVDFSADSGWFGVTQKNNAKLNAQNQVITKCVTQANLIANYISETLVQYYHSQVGATTDPPNIAADCK